MKKLIVARHGWYGEGEHIDDRGKTQMKALACVIGPQITGARVKLLSSTATRARESAEYLGDLLMLVPECHEILWADRGRREDLPKALELVRQNMDDVDVLIIMSHPEYAENLPGYFQKCQLGMECGFWKGEVKRGEAVAIDCHTCAVSLIPPA